MASSDLQTGYLSSSEEEDALAAKKKSLSAFITSLGNFSVQANFQAISIALVVMTAEVCTLDDDGECKEGHQAPWVSSTLTAMVFAGSICGQLTMGYAGDIMGRDKAMAFTLMLATLGALFSAALPYGSATSIYGILMACRFLLGIGLGGVYPLSATKAAEDGAKGGKANNRSAARAFFWQAPGSMVPWVLVLILVQTDMSTDAKWRLLLGFGSIPLSIAVFCCYIESTLPSKKVVVAKPTESHSIFHLLSDRDILLKFLGTGGGWFIFDVCYYGVGLFGGAILASVNDGEEDDITTDSSITLIAWQETIALGAGIPAYLLSNYLIKIYGMKTIQIWGFVITAICFLVMAVCFFPLKKSSPNTLYALYVFLLFSLCFGPNVTTYVLPASVYDKSIRSTMNGFSAALGKVGAVVGAYMFGAIAVETSYPTVMIFCAVLSLVGALVTRLYIPDGLDDIASRSERVGLLNDDISEEKRNLQTTLLA